ncbi:MAG: phosphatase [Clostridia bacterium]|nr:phosphatase [Clostridia bacterium]
MKKFAVIDIGSNSVRLMFVADGKVLYKRLSTTRLGEGIATSSRLKTEAIERSARAVSEFYTQAKNEGAEQIAAFATAAVRTAENRVEFLDRVKALCGLTVEVISGEEEAEIGILGALGICDGGVIDVGGASTEIVVKKDGALAYKKSVNIGVVRLKDKCGRDKNALQATANAAANEYGGLPNICELHAIGGTATTLAALELGLTEYSSGKVTGTLITDVRMRELADKLSAMSLAEIAALPCMPTGRADVITGGAVLLSVLMQRLDIQKLIVSDRDNLEGYAIKKGWMQ